MRLQPHHGLILRVIQKLDERLKAVRADVEIRLLRFEPAGQILHRAAVFELQAVIFEHVTQRRQQILGLEIRHVPASTRFCARSHNGRRCR